MGYDGNARLAVFLHVSFLEEERVPARWPGSVGAWIPSNLGFFTFFASVRRKEEQRKRKGSLRRSHQVIPATDLSVEGTSINAQPRLPYA